ncbi:MAG: transcriptional regulator [Rhodobacteraceae bacterium]|nr:MAG: transcriptional regulator [Paracoccaceae bacterium]
MPTRDDITTALAVGEPSFNTDDPRLASILMLAEHMGDTAPDKDAPVREVPSRLGDNWSALLLLVLRTGTYRHATLKRVIALIASEGAISQRMLTLRLRALERDGFVTRHIYPSSPPRVEYDLTELGHGLTLKLIGLINWVSDHEGEILQARSEFTPD